MADLVRIGSDRLSAAINPLGAELTQLRDADGRELMTDADPAFWPKHAPILFPVIGVVNGGVVHVDGVAYPMPRHGFARDRHFAIAAQDAASVTFALDDDEATRAAYPFAFRLTIRFAIEGATLSIEARIANRGEAAMPAQFGFHPAFAWPLPFGRDRADHHIVFDHDEPAPLRRILPDGLIAPDPRPSPLDGRTLALADTLFVEDALVWDRLASQGVTYGAPDGPRLRVDFPDTPMLGIWTKPGARFVCIEPWHGIADPEGFTGDLRTKPGVFEIVPGGEKLIGLRITLDP